MPLETVTHISDLNASNPPGTDTKAQGDDHIRNVKTALKTDFPNVNGVINFTPAQANVLASMAALAVLANGTNAAAAPTAVAAASDGQVLRRSGTAVAFGAIDSSNPAAVNHPALFSYNTADSTFAGVAYADVTNMQTLTLEANSVYEVEAFMYVSNGGASGFGAKLLYSQTPQSDVAQAISSSISGPNQQIIEFFTASGITAAPGTGVSGDQTMHWKGMVKSNAGNGGTVKMQMKQASNAGTSTAKANLCGFRFTKVA